MTKQAQAARDESLRARVATTTGQRFAILARVSTKDQLTGYSLKLQEKEAREYIQRAGGTVADSAVYSAQESGTVNQEDRHVLQRLLADAERHLFDALVVQETTRLSRHMGVMASVMEKLVDAGITLHDFGGPLQIDTPEGEFSVAIQALVGRLGARQSRNKSIRSRQHVLQSGGIAAGRPPFGREWDKDAKRFEIIPKRQIQINRAYDLIVRRSKSMRYAAAELNMAESSLRKAISSAALLEIKQHLNGEEFTIPSPALLTVEKQQQLVQRLARNATVRSQSKGQYLLQGLCRCAGCGRSMTGQTSIKGGRSHMLYRHPVPPTGTKLPSGCAWGVPVTIIDAHVIMACAAMIKNGGALRSAITSAIVQADSGQADLAERVADVKRLITAAAKKLSQQLDVLVESEKGSEVREEIQQKIKRTERTLADRRAEHAELSSQLAVIELPKGGADAIAAKLRSLYWDAGFGPTMMLPFSKRKEFVRAIVGRIDRKSLHGVFVKAHRPAGGSKKDISWSYELRGCLGLADGLVTPWPEGDFYSPEVRDLRVAPSAVQQLAALAADTPGIKIAERKMRINPSSDD